MTIFPDELISPYAPVIVTQDLTDLDVTVGGKEEVTLTRALRNGLAKFDISGILRTAFVDKSVVGHVPGVPSIPMITDYLLSGETVELSNSSASSSVTPQRVIPPRGKDNDVRGWGYPEILCTLLTEDHRKALLKRYEGFPLYVGLQSRLDETAFTVTKVDGSQEHFMLSQDIIRLIDCAGFSSLTCRDLMVEFVDACTPDTPIYVRWINSMGGWEYYMFGGFHGLGQRTKRGDTFRLANASDLNAVEIDGELPPTVTDYVTCGAEQLDRTGFMSLREIATSPYVQVYDTSRKLFTRCLVSSTDIVWNTQASRGQIDLELTLMSPYTQF